MDTGQPYWLIRNSWSARWGEAGYIRLARYPQGEPCGWNVNPQNGDGCLGETAPERACAMCGTAYDALYPRAKRNAAWRGLDPAETWRCIRKDGAGLDDGPCGPMNGWRPSDG